MFRSLLERMPETISRFINQNVRDDPSDVSFLKEFASGTHDGKTGIDVINLVFREKEHEFYMVLVCGQLVKHVQEQFVAEFDFSAFIEFCFKDKPPYKGYENVIFPLISNKIVMKQIFEVMPEPPKKAHSILDKPTDDDLSKYVKYSYYNHGFISSAPSVKMKINDCEDVSYQGLAHFTTKKRFMEDTYELRAYGQGSSEFNIEGCYGNGIHTGEYLDNETRGDGVWIHKNGKLKGEGSFSKYEMTTNEGKHDQHTVKGWVCEGKLSDTESNNVIFDGEFSNTGWIRGIENCEDGSTNSGYFNQNNLLHGQGQYTNSTETVTQSGEWCEGKKNSLFLEKTVGSRRLDLYYTNDVVCGGYAYKRPRSMSLFFNSLKKRIFKVKEGCLFYYSDGERNKGIVEKGHIDLQDYDVYDSKSKKVVCEDPYCIVLRNIHTVGLLERREIVLDFHEWKSEWPKVKELWLKLVRDGIDYSIMKNRKEPTGAMSGFSKVYEPTH